MRKLFPKLETIYDPERQNDTKYAGATVIKKMWDYLECDKLLETAGITKRSGVPPSCLALTYTLKPMMNAGSINRANKRTMDDQLLGQLIQGHDQSTLNRFLNAPNDWKALNAERVKALQKHKRTRARVDGLVILDDVVIKKSGKRMEKIAYVYDPVEKKAVLGYDMVALYYSDEERSYPISFAYKLKENDRITLAIELVEELDDLGVKTRLITFDSWYFVLELVTRIRDLGLGWVTKSKGNRLFTVDGVALHAEEMIDSGIRETLAELPGYGPVKLVVAEINERRCLLVSGDAELDGGVVVSVYRERFQIDNPFFRDSKQEMGLGDFHTRRLVALVAHTALCFLSYTLVSMVRLFDGGLLGRSVGWVKENLFRAVAGVRWVGGGLAVFLGRGLELLLSLCSV